MRPATPPSTLKSDKPPKSDVAARLRPAYLSMDELLDDLGHEVVHGNKSMFGPASLESREISPVERRIALAISGGGAAGAYSAGLIEALLPKLEQRGAKPDVILGTSSGALNGYGVFLQALGKDNPQLREDPRIKQPYSSFIASIWSYLDRDQETSSWIVGRRSWMIDIATRGIDTPLRRWGLGLAILLGLFLFNPFLFVSLFLFFELDWLLPSFIRDWGQTGGEPAWQLAFLGLLSLVGLGVMLMLALRTFGRSLFRDTPLLRMLANTGPDGDLSRPWRWSHGQTVDRARVLSRDLVAEWYTRMDELPELIITATNITVGRECLFTLVRPDTYARLVKNGWLAVQLDCRHERAKAYHAIDGALMTLGENLLQCVVASTAVPSAFPTQEMGIYRPGSRHDVRHRFVDGGVLNNSPIHLAIDMGATHVISLELDPIRAQDPMEMDDRGRNYNILEAGVTTFTTLLDRAIERDIRRTVTWNRFLVERPEALLEKPARRLVEGEASFPREAKRVIPLYRIAPAKREIDTVEFDGRYENGRKVSTVRDVLRRGMLDLQGRHIWRATLQSIPHKEGQAPPK